MIAKETSAMRRVLLGGTGIETSALGFGAASLGSRVGAAEGRRALEAAFEAGVTWLDLAPVYGGGAAEAIAAPFLRAHRDRVQVATKAGLALSGGAGAALRRRLMPLARGLRALGGPAGHRLRAAAPKANARAPLTPAAIAASLEASLRRLGVERVDLFALHMPNAEEVRRDEIRAALAALVAAGKARAVGVAGDAAAAAAALEAGAPYGVVQLAVPAPGAAGEAVLAAARVAGAGAILHSVFGPGPGPGLAGGAVPGGAPDATSGAASDAVPDAASDAARGRLKAAFAANPEGVVLVSMLSARSRAATLAVAREPFNT